MPNLDHTKAIQLYWQEVKEKYPHLSFDRFELICKSPFLAIRHWIRRGDFPIIMLKYMGKFKVTKPKVKVAIRINKLKFDQGHKTEEQYKFHKEFLDNYLEQMENEERDIQIINDHD